MTKKVTETEYHPWSLHYNDYDQKKEKSRESLLTVGNGYLGTRGALEEGNASDINYPGTYMAGLYNRLISKVAGRDIENEDLVNIPNWTSVTFRVNNGEWLDINNVEPESIQRKLDFSDGLLTKEMVVRDAEGRETKVLSRRIASMAEPHLVALEYSVIPQNYSGTIEIRSELNGQIINDGVARYRELNQEHIAPVSETVESETGLLKVTTTQSKIEIALAAKHQIFLNGSSQTSTGDWFTEKGKIGYSVSADLKSGDTLSFEKIVAIYTSKADDSEDPAGSARKLAQTNMRFNEILEASRNAWKAIWDKIDIQIEGDPKSQMLVRLHLYHLMVAASPHNKNIDAGIAARGLHGEAYRGHIFWDELYILPVYDLFLPEVARSVLNYRFRRLDKAREYAREHGYKGAMFPWQSGSDGREETQIVHLNPVSGKWGDDYSSLQRHISIAIAYNTWYYFQVTGDLDFMKESGAELFLEICRFWASKAQIDQKTGRYSILKVMGPDEFHEKHEKSPGGGLKDNAYTNIMVAWLFEKAFEIIEKLPSEVRDKVMQKTGISLVEFSQWGEIGRKLNIPISEEGIIEQFDGYFELKELDWDAYREKYGNIYRLDRILKAEGKSPDDYKLAKQADTLMTFYNIDEEDVSRILLHSGYTLPKNYLVRNYEYYLNRTSHGSTLSRIVHAYLAQIYGNKREGNQLYFEALQSDFTDIQGGTTAEGIHAGVMGGTVLMVITAFAGINLKKEVLEINPSLPDHWKLIKFNFQFKGGRYFMELSHKELKIELKSEKSEDTTIEFRNKKIILPANQVRIFEY